VVFGTETTAQGHHTVDLAAAAAGHKGNATAPAVWAFHGHASNERFGEAVAALDFNLDGVLDLIVSAPGFGFVLHPSIVRVVLRAACVVPNVVCLACVVYVERCVRADEWLDVQVGRFELLWACVRVPGPQTRRQQAFILPDARHRNCHLSLLDQPRYSPPSSPFVLRSFFAVIE